ncbi:hypothetical protein NEPAR06_0632 [Nematocida parisii]|nr:hypothetical protein NEPAR08_0815 [Nematocida parisii]KAI5183204.1 hypothetical protein NEIRO03_0822 [Nematocida sp. AWRm78]OAG33266.1 hypothetical protein NEIG_01016 [Nematocida sp. ERTm5]KAI5127285.1 hypothetical protein NEPAR03_0889 [Nematocida parisii]KAI5141393.1 hypothetical protein NEPAR04_0946 [Nematocida parisii]
MLGVNIISKQFSDAIMKWEPITEMIEEGLDPEEIECISVSISDTLSEFGRINKTDQIVLDLEDFLYDVFEEYGVCVSDDLLSELVEIVLKTHNSKTRTKE